MLRIGRRQALFATLTAGTSAGAVLSMALPPRPALAQSALLGQLIEGPPKPVPDLSFTDADGARKTVADFAGKGLVMNFWATWCAPCVQEMPALDRTQAALTDLLHAATFKFYTSIAGLLSSIALGFVEDGSITEADLDKALDVTTMIGSYK